MNQVIKLSCAFALTTTLVLTPAALAAETPEATTSDNSTLAAAAPAEETAASPAAAAAEAPEYGTIIFQWVGKEVFRENIANGKTVTIYKDETKQNLVDGTPLTVDTTTLSEDFKKLVEFQQFYKVGKTITWNHELTPEGNLVIWPTYTDSPTAAEDAVEDKAPYTFIFKWKLKSEDGTISNLPWFVSIPSIMDKQPVNKATSDDVRTWLANINPNIDFVNYLVDENEEWAAPEQMGMYEYAGLKDAEATGAPHDAPRSISNEGYYKFTPLSEYRLEQANKAAEDANTRADEAKKAAEDAKAETATEKALREAAESALKDAQDELKAAQDEIADLKKQLADEQQKRADAEKARDDALATNKTLTEANNVLTSQNQTLTDENAKLTDENTKFSDANTKLSDENAKLADENAALKDELSKLKAQSSNTTEPTATTPSSVNTLANAEGKASDKGASLVPETGDSVPVALGGAGIIAAFSAAVVALIARLRKAEMK